MAIEVVSEGTSPIDFSRAAWELFADSHEDHESQYKAGCERFVRKFKGGIFRFFSPAKKI